MNFTNSASTTLAAYKSEALNSLSDVLAVPSLVDSRVDRPDTGPVASICSNFEVEIVDVWHVSIETVDEESHFADCVHVTFFGILELERAGVATDRVVNRVDAIIELADLISCAFPSSFKDGWLGKLVGVNRVLGDQWLKSASGL